MLHFECSNCLGYLISWAENVFHICEESVLLHICYCFAFKVAPYPDKQGAPVKEIQEFAPREVYVPYVTYRFVLL